MLSRCAITGHNIIPNQGKEPQEDLQPPRDKQLMANTSNLFDFKLNKHVRRNVSRFRLCAHHL